MSVAIQTGQTRQTGQTGDDDDSDFGFGSAGETGITWPSSGDESDRRPFDISRDGTRFLMVKRAASGETSSEPEIILVQNWVEELKRLVPTDN